MSNATDTIGCLSHRPNCRFFIMYEDFQDVALAASGKEHENKLAAFWRVLETKTNDRIGSIPKTAEDCRKKGIPIPEEHLWVEVTYSECVNRSRKIYKESAFQLAAAESERLGFSKSRVLKRPRNPDDPESTLEEYKEYLFHTAIMQSVINGGDLPTPIDFNTPLLKSYNKRKEEKKAKRAVEINSPPVLKSIAPPIEINTNKYNKVSSKDKKDTEEERESSPAHRDASASAHTPSEPSEQKLQQIIEDKTANGVGSPPAPSKEAINGQEAIQANVPGAHKRMRRQKLEIDAQTQKRIDLVVEALNGMKQEVTGDPEAHYFVFQKDTEAIVEKLLPQSPTPTKLRRVFLDMWNEKDRNGNYFWRKRMKIHNICNEYESRMMGLEGKTPTPSNSDGPSALVAAGYTNNHTPKAGEPLIKFKPLVRRT